MVHIDSDLASRAYLLTNLSAGPFRIGAAIRDSILGFELDRSVESTIVADGLTIGIPVYTYYIGNEGWVRVRPMYDPEVGQASDKIGEIYVYSELFLTDKFIGPISSPKDFALVYPDITIDYCGEDEMFVVATPQLPNVQFLLSAEDYISSRPDSLAASRRKLHISDFRENCRFEAVRIRE